MSSFVVILWSTYLRLCFIYISLFTIGEKRLFKGPAFEATGQALILVVNHIVIHRNRIVTVHITFYHLQYYVRNGQEVVGVRNNASR